MQQQHKPRQSTYQPDQANMQMASINELLQVAESLKQSNNAVAKRQSDLFLSGNASQE